MAALMVTSGSAGPQTRLQVLDPFIAAVQRTLADPARQQRDDAPVRLRFSGTDLTVDPWTHQRLDPGYHAGNPLLADCSRVVTQSVALLAKCAQDLSFLEEQSSSSGGSVYSARAELMLDAAIGGSLVRDVQHVIDELLKRGHRDEAAHLSKFHHQLRHTVYDLRKQVSPEERSTVESLAARLSDSAPEERPGQAAPAAGAKPSGPPSASPARQRPRTWTPTAPRGRHPDAEPTPHEAAAPAEPSPARLVPLRTKALAALLAGTALILFASRPAGSSAQARSVAASITAPSFPGIDPRVEERWPGLYVTVAESAWNELDEGRRLELVRELTGTLAAARYSGAFVRSDEGRPLAEWQRTTGARLLDSRAEERGSTP